MDLKSLVYISSLGPEEKDLWSPAVRESSFPIVFSAMVADASVAIPSCFKHETFESCDPSVLTVIPQARKDFLTTSGVTDFQASFTHCKQRVLSGGRMLPAGV